MERLFVRVCPVIACTCTFMIVPACVGTIMIHYGRIMIDFRPDVRVWRQVADELRHRIQAGIYQLRDEGLIYTVAQIGSFVTRDDGENTAE